MLARNYSRYPLPSPTFWDRALAWASKQYQEIAYLNPSETEYPHGSFVRGLACGSIETIRENAGAAFEQLATAQASNPDWWFGHFGYELKNELEKLESNHPGSQGFGDLCFFRPKHWLHLEDDELVIESVDNPDDLLREIEATSLPTNQLSVPPLQPTMPKAYYLDTVEYLREHIAAGDVYEINFCQEFSTQAPSFDPVAVVLSLQSHSPAPFGVYYRQGEQHLMCASPERFLKKQGSRLVSQPIKGTAARGASPEEDVELKAALLGSEKERAENLMIVDLVRNDLARSAKPGTVKVEELFGIYSFPQVHQMISTVTAELRPEVTGLQAIANAFPMGSMTGAPKIKVMELVEQYELARRGLYSGAVGYFTPEGDFDFNVVIRSLFYNGDSQTLSYQVGGAITYDSDPEQEYAECLIKARGIQRALGHA